MRLGRPFWLMAVLLAVGEPSWGLPDFTFLHVSDLHVPYALQQTQETLSQLPRGEALNLEPYGLRVEGPSFVIATGDLTEYGGGNGWWEQYLALWRDFPLPVYHQLGNHDNTWDCGRPRLRRIHGQAFYAFERFGAKFIGWDTATPQDPRPSVSTEGILWLQAELARTPPEQPLFFFCHHPLEGKEFASDYDRARLLDLLRTRNVVLLLVGHGHGARAWRLEGFDAVMGGSTFGKTPGFGIVAVKEDTLYVCHQYVAPERKMVPLLCKPLPQRSPFLEVVSLEPSEGKVFREGEPLAWRVRVEPSEKVQRARWALDGRAEGELTPRGEAWSLELKRKELTPGAHTLRFEFTDSEGQVTSRSVAFWLDGRPLSIVWKEHLPASCQSTPTVAGGRLYLGANDGHLYAFEAATGRILWRFPTGGEVRSQPQVIEGLILFGSADGSLYALKPDGSLAWRFEAGQPIYASPRWAQGEGGAVVFFGTNGGDAFALEAATGRILWRSEAPEYAIETAPAVGEDTVYFGAWDRFVYAFDRGSGVLRWRRPTRGSEGESGAARYFSPADCAPALIEGRLFVADRAYFLTLLDGQSGERLLSEERCVALAPSADGRSVYLRHTDHRVSKRRSDGSILWEAKVPTGYVATPPLEAGGRVFVLSSLGLLSVLDANDGSLLTQYQAFPFLYAFAAPAFDGERVYVVDMGGNLLALGVALGREDGKIAAEGAKHGKPAENVSGSSKAL